MTRILPWTLAPMFVAPFAAGTTPALWIGAVVVGLGAVAAFAIPTVRRQRGTEADALTPLADTA